jgi:hypothetical protein
MSVTSIQFIGLFVVMMNSGAGLHILLPHFPGTVYADHTSVIQYNPDQAMSTTWPGITSCGPSGTLRCAPIDVETITFSGASDPSPSDIVGDIPHLRCCCSLMTDILPKYKDPAASGKLSAHIFVEKGAVEAIAAGNGRVDTWVTMHSSDPSGITVTGVASPSISYDIVFKPGAQFTILNSMPTTPTSPPHFLAYYLMGTGSGDCTTVPSDGSPCAPQATECSILKAKANPSTKSSTKSAPKTAAETAAKTSTHMQSKKPGRPGPVGKKPPVVKTAEVDVDCANSHFP